MRVPHDRKRDGQQWVYDWVVKDSGKPFNFEYEGRYFPQAVKSHAMIPKHMGLLAKQREQMGLAAMAAGHLVTALDLLWEAVDAYFQAQHAIFDRDNPDKERYYNSMSRCYDHIIELSPYPIERFEVPWEHTEISCLFHHIAETDEPAPCVLSIPGMDRSKEHWFHPNGRTARGRGFHVVTMDGPGQGVSNFRDNPVTDDNYERAASEVIRHLRTRPEIDPERIGIFGSSFGTHWAVRTAAYSDEVAALAVAAPVFGPKVPIFDQAAPRFKQVFMYMAAQQDEATFDEMASKMTTSGYGNRINSPTLIITGEFDPLSPLEEALSLFTELSPPREMWILEDDFHRVARLPGLGGLDVFPFAFDWLADALTGRLPADLDVTRIVSPGSGRGPYTPPASGDEPDE